MPGLGRVFLGQAVQSSSSSCSSSSSSSSIGPKLSGISLLITSVAVSMKSDRGLLMAVSPWVGAAHVRLDAVGKPKAASLRESFAKTGSSDGLFCVQLEYKIGLF